VRTTAVIKRIFRQMIRDKRTLGLLFIAPLLILSLMYLIFNGDTVEPKLGVFNADKGLVHQLKESEVNVKTYQSNDKQLIKEDDLDGFLQIKDNDIILTLENSDPSVSKTLEVKVKQAAAAFSQSKLLNKNPSLAQMPKESIQTHYVYGNDKTASFDVLSPVLVGFFVFFFVFLISGIGLLKERTSGTLERLLSTPIRRWEIVAAYLVGFGLFAVIQTIIVVVYSITILDINVVGSVWNVMLINLLLALVALSLGTLLSAFAASEFQMIQFIPIVVVPQVFFSGIFPLEGMANWLQAISKIMPLSYGADALKGIMYKGFGLGDIWKDIMVLAIFAVIFIFLNVIALKKYRKL